MNAELVLPRGNQKSLAYWLSYRKGDMIAFYECLREVNTREGEDLFKLKGNSTRANGYKWTMNKLRQIVETDCNS